MKSSPVYSILSVLMLLFLFCPSEWGEARAADGKVFVLCYHSFLDNKRFDGNVPLGELKAQLDLLRGKGFRFVSYTDLQKGTVTGAKNALVVIDDGNQSVLQAYRTVFKPRNIKPMLAIYPNIIGKKAYALTWDQLKELSDDGCGIAAHGFYHLILNRDLYEKDRKAFVKEIFGPKEYLERRLNTTVTAYVYPNGVRADITKETVREAGYSCAFIIEWGQVLCPLKFNRDPYELPRYMIYKSNWDMISSAIIRAAEAR